MSDVLDVKLCEASWYKRTANSNIVKIRGIDKEWGVIRASWLRGRLCDVGLFPEFGVDTPQPS